MYVRHRNLKGHFLTHQKSSQAAKAIKWSRCYGKSCNYLSFGLIIAPLLCCLTVRLDDVLLKIIFASNLSAEVVFVLLEAKIRKNSRSRSNIVPTPNTVILWSHFVNFKVCQTILLPFPELGTRQFFGAFVP